jgi:hypothetical protein
MKLSSCLLALVLWSGLHFLGSKNCHAQILLGSFPPSVSPGFRATPTGSYPIIARGPQREVLRSMPIELRPYRPLHFYGNAVRRNYYGQTMNPFGNRF